MSLEKTLYSPLLLKQHLPLSASDSAKVEVFRNIAIKSLEQIRRQIPLILGPCSIHDVDKAIEYGEKIAALQREVRDSFFLVMRVYVEKPRSSLGWKGLIYDPLLNGSSDIKQGIYLARLLFLELTKRDIPIAMEFVNPLTGYFLQDLVTWGFIGARTSTSQIHREFASSLSFPIGFKNTVEGCLDIPIDAIKTARAPHSFLGLDSEGRVSALESMGNPHTHLVLRGSYKGPNYDRRSIEQAFSIGSNRGLNSPLLIDCAHGNSNKNHHTQEEVFQELTLQIVEGNSLILGLMLESYLEEGNQELNEKIPPQKGISITDPCISFERTKELILWGHQEIQKSAENINPHLVLPGV